MDAAGLRDFRENELEAFGILTIKLAVTAAGMYHTALLLVYANICPEHTFCNIKAYREDGETQFSMRIRTTFEGIYGAEFYARCLDGSIICRKWDYAPQEEVETMIPVMDHEAGFDMASQNG